MRPEIGSRDGGIIQVQPGLLHGGFVHLHGGSEHLGLGAHGVVLLLRHVVLFDEVGVALGLDFGVGRLRPVRASWAAAASRAT